MSVWKRKEIQALLRGSALLRNARRGTRGRRVAGKPAALQRQRTRGPLVSAVFASRILERARLTKACCSPGWDGRATLTSGKRFT
jgi:hypothetical protein